MNLSGILTLLDQLPVWEETAQQLDGDDAPPPLQLPTNAQTAVAAKLYLQRQQPTLIIVGRVDQVDGWRQALETWLPEAYSVNRLPEPTPLPYDRAPWSDRSRTERVQTLAGLLAGQHPHLPAPDKPPLIIASARALLQKTMPKRQFIAAARALRVGQIIELKKTILHWRDIGYEEVSVVEAPCQFSRRGGILDIYPVAAPYPVRIELFDDEIDTMRYFDPATQRTVQLSGGDGVERVAIPPAREALPLAAQAYATSLPDDAHPTADALPSWRDDVADLEAGKAFPNLEFYIPLIYPRPSSVFEYLPENTLIMVEDWQKLETAVAEFHDHADQIANEQIALPPNYPSPIFTWDEFSGELDWQRPLILGERESEDMESALAEAFEPGPRFGGQTRPLITQLKTALRENERVIIVSRQAARLAELWRQEKGNGGGDKRVSLLAPPAAPQSNLTPQVDLPIAPPDGTLTFVQGSLAEGFNLLRQDNNQILLSLLTDAEIFGWKRPEPRRFRSSQPIAPETRFADIEAGDYVVHLEYGIGQFQGLVVRYIGGAEREYLLVNYANEAAIYVPVHNADRLSKWIGSSDIPPQLHRLGGAQWSKSKEKAQRAANELAGELLELYAARETIAGHAFAADGEWQAELEAGFPYRETEDQLRVIAEVKADMERPLPMDRLVCGDVGYGKTEVALRAAFKAVLDGKQVAVLVPTTILAQQHFNTFKERLQPFPVKVEMLSRFRTQSRQDRIVEGLRNGQVDIIVGTHRLLSDDVAFHNLGLLIIDEEQRFGVAHKEKFKQWRVEVDVLTMTATPIPRTMHMGLTGVRDISIIDTAPAERLPVQTYVGEFDESRLRRAILREMDRGGQLFFVHNRVQSIHMVADRLQKLVPEAMIAVGHGQMSERQLEKIMVDFEEKKIDILLSTTIIESGLDFPNANTIIVDKAEMFGLAQLYQLRGRVGRGVRRAYAYLFHGRWRGLSDVARARLETIAENTQLGAGYTIAMRDMEIRGVGDLLGGAQSGQISAVGFDLYTRLLTNAVKKQKAAKRGEVVSADLPQATQIDLPLAAYIPPDYVPDAGLRLRLYRRMATLETLEEIDATAAELADRFGEIPDPVDNLLYQLRIKALARLAGATAVTAESDQIKIRVSGLEHVDRFRLQRFLGTAVRVSRSAIWLRQESGTHNWKVELVQVLERLQEKIED